MNNSYNQYNDSSSSSSSNRRIPDEWMIFIFVSVTVFSCCLVRWCHPIPRDGHSSQLNDNADNHNHNHNNAGKLGLANIYLS